MAVSKKYDFLVVAKKIRWLITDRGSFMMCRKKWMWNHPLRTIWIGEYMQKDYDDYEDEMMRLAMGMDSGKFPPFTKNNTEYGGKLAKTNQPNEETDSKFSIKTPMGDIEIDFEQMEVAKKNAKMNVSPPETTLGRKMTIEFLEGKEFHDFNYWNHNFGSLIKLHMEQFYEKDNIVKEFDVENGCVITKPTYGNITIGSEGAKRFLQSGFRFYERNGEKFVVISSMDQDGDQRLVFVASKEGRGLELIEELEEDFYRNGPLKGAFFDMKYNFIERSKNVEKLLAWNPEIKKQLEKDVIQFLNIMPILNEKGLPNSRGIILAGPPGTGKTMYAKALASKTKTTTILISAEMISQRFEVKTIFQMARKLAPSLVIIEDIDTAGTVSRRVTDHPILGEYLQSMDGMEANNGVVVVATTNHTENIDPAISDRPGRFDRIIQVPLPDKSQRKQIIQNLLKIIPSEKIPNKALVSICSRSSGLSGAWIKELVQTSFIETVSNGREKITLEDLEYGLQDVLGRRGMAYIPTMTLNNTKSDNSSVYVA